MSSSRGQNVFIRRDMHNVMQTMFNDPRYSNVRFRVNDDVFYAERGILGASSIVWENFLFSSSPESQPRPREMTEYHFTNVKHSESFLILLKVAYGIAVNISQLSDEVLEESLGMANTFVFDKFHHVLLVYAAKYRPHLKSVFDNYDAGYVSRLLEEKGSLNDVESCAVEEGSQ